MARFFSQFLISAVEVLLLFFLIIYILQFLLTYFNPQKTKDLISRVHPVPAHFLSALFGAVTPFCTCSGIPIFTGLIKGGVPAGVAFSFLITSPLVNEIAFAGILSIFGLKIAIIYLIFGLGAGIFGGMILGRMHVEKYFKKSVQTGTSCCTTMQNTTVSTCCQSPVQPSLQARLKSSWNESWSMIKPIIPFLVIGIAIGVAVSIWFDPQWMQVLGNYNQFVLIPLGIIAGAPIYTSITAVIPVVGSLVAKGMGTGLAFALIMSIGGMSFPEWAILSGIMKKRILFTFIAITGLLILCISYIFAFLDLWS